MRSNEKIKVIRVAERCSEKKFAQLIGNSAINVGIGVTWSLMKN